MPVIVFTLHMPGIELLVLSLRSICYLNFYSVFVATILWRIKMIIALLVRRYGRRAVIRNR